MGKVAEAQADIASSRKADPSLAKVSFKFALIFQNVIDVLKFKFESLGLYSLLFFCISNFELILVSFPLYTVPFCPTFVMPSLSNMLTIIIIIIILIYYL